MPKTLVAILAVALTSASAFAIDSDPGYGPRSEAGAVRKTRSGAAVFYKPTMRYYGKGFTVAYRYIQTKEGVKGGTTSFEREQLYLPAASIQSVINAAPRLTYYYDGRPATQILAPSSATEARSVVTAPTPAVKELPPIAEQTKK